MAVKSFITLVPVSGLGVNHRQQWKNNEAKNDDPLVKKFFSGWKTTLLTSIFLLPTSVNNALRASWCYTDGRFCRCWCRCWRMLVGLVSSHPKADGPCQWALYLFPVVHVSKSDSFHKTRLISFRMTQIRIVIATFWKTLNMMMFQQRHFPVTFFKKLTASPV